MKKLKLSIIMILLFPAFAYAGGGGATAMMMGTSGSAAAAICTTQNFEDTGVWTEADGETDITLSGSTITVDTMIGTVTSYVRRNYGVNGITNIKVDFHTKWTNCSGPWVTVGIMTLGNTAQACLNDLDIANDGIVAQFTLDGSSVYRITLIDRQDNNSDAYIAAINTDYYCTFERVHATGVNTLKIYSDSDRTTLLDTLTVTDDGTAYIYLTALSSERAGGAVSSTGVIDSVCIY